MSFRIGDKVAPYFNTPNIVGKITKFDNSRPYPILVHWNGSISSWYKAEELKLIFDPNDLLKEIL